MNQQYVKTILYVCPGMGWTTKERTALKDMTIAKANGYEVIVYLEEDSVLYNFAKMMNIEYICVEPHFLNRLTVFHNHIPIRKLVDARRIDIVHCYDFSYLFSISFQLQGRFLVSLVMTQSQVVEKQLRRYWYRPIITRIDSLIMLSKHLKHDAIGGLQLPIKKIEYFGMGINREGASFDLEEEVKNQLEYYSDYFLVGCYISPMLNNFKTILPVLSALIVINQKLPAGKRSKVALISNANFKDIPIFEPMARFIQENGLQDDLIFITSKDVESVQSSMKLWLSLEGQDLLEDYAVSAILSDLPVLFIRNFCTVELLREFQGVGETYKAYDARELREKWENILLSYNVYSEKAQVFKYFFEKEFSYKKYKTNLLGIYTRIVQRRSRLFKK